MFYNEVEVKKMSNFDALKHYIMPSDVLMDMLDIYRILGMNVEYQKKLAAQSVYLRQAVIEKDTFYVASLLAVEISDHRLRLLITKNAVPKNKEEQIVLGIKKVVRLIQDRSVEKYPFNGSELLEYLNLIYGKNSHRFSNALYEKEDVEKRMSVRLALEKMLEEYHEYHQEKWFEPVFLSVIAYMEVINIKAFSKNNELAGILALYYMLLRLDILSFRYVSFFEIYMRFKKELDTAVARGSISYKESYLSTTDTVRLVFEMIRVGYAEIEKMIKNFTHLESAFKSDVIEETILKKMPTYFTKEEVRRLHPDASDSTINRILFKLRDEQIIMPLGKGRSARWMKLISDQDPRILFGGRYETTEEEE